MVGNWTGPGEESSRSPEILSSGYTAAQCTVIGPVCNGRCNGREDGRAVSEPYYSQRARSLRLPSILSTIFQSYICNHRRSAHLKHSVRALERAAVC